MQSNLVPAIILNNHAQGVLAGEFASVALFTDISGFSAVNNALIQHGNEAAEIMADIMLDIFTPLVDIIYSQGGFITTFAGDAFTALFLDEPGQESPYRRALEAAVAIQQHMITTIVHEAIDGKFPFAVKLGIGDGQVTWGILTPKNPQGLAAYYFRGSAITTAAEAEHDAQPGNIILTASVAQTLADQIETIPQGANGNECLLNVLGTLPTPQLLAEPTSMQEQSAFVPESILDLPEYGEFRQVVTVFINLQNIDTHQDLANFMDAVFGLLVSYGGYLARVDFGDKGANLLLFWGMPTTTEHDIERALYFVYDLNNYTPNTFKAGITYQPMYAGLAGSTRRGEYTAYGKGINYAARLMVKAEWGSVWLDERIANRVGQQFIIEKIGEYEFKGFTEPQTVYALVGKHADDTPHFFQNVMVGRQTELARLNEFVAPLFTSTEHRFAGIMVVEGEAGMGKSRLVAEFEAQLTANPPKDIFTQWGLCQTDQTVRGPLNPFRYWLRHYFQQSSNQSESANKRAFLQRFNYLLDHVQDVELRENLERGQSFLGALVDLFWENSSYNEVEPEGRQELTFTALKSLILAESLRQPLILNLEDAHWLDNESIQFIVRLVRQIQSYPIAMIATARPTPGDKSLFAEAPYTRLNLAMMRDDDLLLLAAQLLGSAIGQDIADLLLGRAEGTPFFAEQILLYLRENQQIQVVDGVWSGTRALTNTPLPEDVRVIFTARLDALTSEVKTVVQTAAILGREFDVQVLLLMLRNDPALPEKLRIAESQTIWIALSQISYLFKHALLRDAAYQMQLHAQRRKLHQLAAEALLAIHQASPLLPYGEIAYHYEAAYAHGATKVREQAIEFLHQAGKVATQNYQNETALDYFSRALAILPPEAHATRYELLLVREADYDLLGKRAEQEQDLQALWELVEVEQNLQHQSEIMLRRAKFMENIGKGSEIIPLVQQALHYAQLAGDIRQEADAHLVWAGRIIRIGELENGRDQLRQAQRLAEAGGVLEIQVQVELEFAIMNADQGRYRRALEQSNAALGMAHQIGDRKLEIRSLGRKGLCFRALGNYMEAQEAYSTAVAIARDIGARQLECDLLTSLGTVVALAGDWIEARHYVKVALWLAREINAFDTEARVLILISEIAIQSGEYKQAEEYLTRSLLLVRQLNRPRHEINILIKFGHVAYWQGQYNEAQQYYTSALTLAEKHSYFVLQGIANQCLGTVFLALRQWTEASLALEKSLLICRDSRVIAQEVETQAHLGKLYLAQGDLARVAQVLPRLLDYYDTHQARFEGTEGQLYINLIAYELAVSIQHPRAPEILEKTYRDLMANADKLADEEYLQRSYQYHVPYHRQILALYTGEALPFVSSNGSFPSASLLAEEEKLDFIQMEEKSKGANHGKAKGGVN